MDRGTNNVMDGAESRNEPELRPMSPLARSLFLLQLIDGRLHVGLHNTSQQVLLVLLLPRAWPRFLQEFPPPQSLQRPFQAFRWVSAKARPGLCEQQSSPGRCTGRLRSPSSLIFCAKLVSWESPLFK